MFNYFRINIYPYIYVPLSPFYLIKLHYLPKIFQHGKGRVFKVKYFISSYDPLNPSFIIDLITSVLIIIYHLMWVYMVLISSLYLSIYLFLMIPRVPSLVMPFKNILWSSKGVTSNQLFVIPRVPSWSPFKKFPWSSNGAMPLALQAFNGYEGKV